MIGLALALALSMFALPATPTTITTLSFTGSLDPGNPNDVFFATFTLATVSSLNIQTYGYGGTLNAPGGVNAAGMVIAAGGFDTYVSLFAGTGPSATFLASNDDGLCPPGHASPACHDSTLTLSGLAAGSYTLALSVFDNISFAENLGSGTLGDGFVGFGDYFDAASGTTRTSAYAIDISGNFAVPEPASLWLMLGGFAAVMGRLRYQPRNRKRS
jgi:hypothetical protein